MSGDITAQPLWFYFASGSNMETFLQFQYSII